LALTWLGCALLGSYLASQRRPGRARARERRENESEEGRAQDELKVFLIKRIMIAAIATRILSIMH
jgi:hypothetical protein